MSPIEIIMAVLHMRKTDYDGIVNLAKRILLEGLYIDLTLYATPIVAKTEFEAQLQLTSDAVALAEKGGDKAQRTKQIKALYKMLRKLVNYVNGLYEGDEVSLKKSGFDINMVPSKHGFIDQLVIKRIVKGNLPHTVKISIEPMTGDEKNKTGSKNFIVRIYADMTTEECLTIAAGSDSRNIIIENIPFLVAKYYSISVKNSAGENMSSARIKFILTD
jgi:hypothetical protein